MSDGLPTLECGEGTGVDEIDELLSIRAAELYYEENKTQDEIGQALRLTRWKVGRLLAQAKQRGFIRIEILHPRARRLAIERRLRDERGLADAIVVSTAGVHSPEELQERTAQAAADYLTALRPVPRTLGVSWGRTLFEISQHLRNGWATGVNVVQINGGVSLNRRAGTAAATAVGIAQKGGGIRENPALWWLLNYKDSRWAGAELSSLVKQELAPYIREGEPRVQIDRPALVLEPETAQAVAVLASAEDRLPESTHFADCDVILSEGEKCPQRRLWAQARSSGGVTARGRRR